MLILLSRTSYNTTGMHTTCMNNQQTTSPLKIAQSLELLPEQQYSKCDSSEYQTPEAEANNCLVHSCMR